ncbi:PEP-CTERM sorting domain-containing protein [Aphanothece hegewaldii CCALA 016]|uniref:PEP-CTERM sorting domain-containing protein n=1 Tax=Aphanothece hegewaldii CCALA 016 TaxID=2107694 RepID=A0A2T1LW46_9CHRO|nr:CHRD domain-containing protein [Aphanothece hegewaldii]PSF36000.1 PEP-CTERM sorting domain-containing protein [Aphanothece hegewaldii CCALA 016]
MRQLWTIPILGAALTSVVAIAPLPATAATFQSNLTGSQEVPPVMSPGSGFATLELTGSPGSWVLDYELTYSGLSSPIASPYAHIHNAPFGSNGPVVHHLDGADTAPIAGSTSGTIIGDWRFDDPSAPLTDALAQQLQQGKLYFNIHTAAIPSGEIRGQITAVPEPGNLMGLALAGSSLLLIRKRKTSHSA